MAWNNLDRQALSVLACIVVVSTEARSQKVVTDVSAAEVAVLLRSNRGAGAAAAVLTQANGPQSRKKLDEIADTLVVIAVGLDGDDLENGIARTIAAGRLARAGLGLTGIAGKERAIPYAGATPRLMRIVETANDVGIRASSLKALAALQTHEELRPFLRKIATSQNPAAYVALEMLIKESGPDGLALARELVRSGAIVQPLAREVGDRFAGLYKRR